MFDYQLAIQINDNDTAKIVSDFDAYIWSLPFINETPNAFRAVPRIYGKSGQVSLGNIVFPFRTFYIFESDLTHWYDITFDCSDIEERLFLEKESLSIDGVHPELILNFFTRMLKELNSLSKVYLGLVGVESGAMCVFEDLKDKIEESTYLIYVNKIDLKEIHEFNQRIVRIID